MHYAGEIAQYKARLFAPSVKNSFNTFYADTDRSRYKQINFRTLVLKIMFTAFEIVLNDFFSSTQKKSA